MMIDTFAAIEIKTQEYLPQHLQCGSESKAELLAKIANEIVLATLISLLQSLQNLSYSTMHLFTQTALKALAVASCISAG